MVRTLFLLVVALAASCARKEDPPAAAKDAPAAPAHEVTLPIVTYESRSLLFYFLDELGRVRTTAAIDEVPEANRARVLVVDLAQTPEQRQAHRYNFFADLTMASADGSYPVTAVSRFDAAKGEGLTAQLAPIPAGSVVVYSAEWCGFCKKAKAWLAEKEVPFIERDVERQPGAAAELDDKLARAMIKGGGVPVIDWDGALVMGFDVRRLEQLLDEKRKKEGAP